jgi:mono/diheme cytochrome c family protein
MRASHHTTKLRALALVVVAAVFAVVVGDVGRLAAFPVDSVPSQQMQGPPAPKGWPAAATQPASTRPVDIPEAHMHSPAQTIAMTRVPAGYRLEVVAAEPDVVAPVCLAWDGNGALYVAEMRTYMLDVDGSHKKDPISRVIRLESTKGDGVYDRKTVFVDKLVLPREILPLDDRILIRQTDTKDVYAYRDTDGDGVADEKVKVYEGGKENGNLEHQPSGLVWNIDNWVYQTHDKTRLRLTRGKTESDKNGLDVGQWGLATDNAGRIFYSTAGSELPANHFQVMPQYGKISLKDEMVPHFTEVFPILPTTDIQGGLRRLKMGGGLSHFTGCGGQSIYRGDALPADLYGDYLLPEPVGRLIRRAKVRNVDGKVVLANAYQGEEFIASMDANFRPVWTATGPDGCVYICDLYHGIIQEAEWTKEGTYLRPHIKKYGLDKNVNGGRVYRLVHESKRPRLERPRMLAETPAQLVAHLSDPNGWWRDTAQKLIILRGDKSVVPALREMARGHANPLSRLHALWTCEGLDSADPDLIIEKLADSDARLRSAAIRIAEPLIAKDDPRVMEALKPVAADVDPNVATQLALSILYAKQPQADAWVKGMLAAREEMKLKVEVPKTIVASYYDAVAKAKEETDHEKRLARRNPQLAATVTRGRENFMQACIACHGIDGQGAAAPDENGMLAPPLAGSRRLTEDKVTPVRIVLKGLVGPHDFGRTYPNEMASFAWADDVFLSSVLTYARQAWGNRAGAISPEDVAKGRRDLEKRDRPFTVEEVDGLRR